MNERRNEAPREPCVDVTSRAAQERRRTSRPLLSLLCTAIGWTVLTLAMPAAAQSTGPAASATSSPAPAGAEAPTPQASHAPSAAAGTAAGAKSDKLVLDNLHGLVFVSGTKAVQSGGVARKGVDVRDVNVLKGKAFARIADTYLGHPLHLSDLNRLVRQTVAYCRAHDRPVVDVFVPEQDVTSGTVQIVVMEGRLGNVKVVNNRWFDADEIKRDIRLQPGEKISAKELEQDLAWINQNPFRKVDAVFVQGDRPGITNVQLDVKERYPLRPYVSYNNSGNPAIGRNMLNVGLNWGNVFDTDQRAGYQYERTGKHGALAAHRLSYTVPLRRRDVLSFSAGYVETDSKLFDVFGVSGRSASFSARYSMPLGRQGRLTQKIQTGFDFRRTNNNLEFFGDQVFDNSSDIVQFVADYSGLLPEPRGSNSWYATLVSSPGGIDSGNRDARFEAMRPGATADYNYVNLGYQRLMRLPGNVTWSATANMQWSDSRLLASQQMGLGGRGSVRGFEPRAVNGDNGLFVSNEIRSPSLRLPWRAGGTIGRVQLLAFLDYGKVGVVDPLPSETSNSVLSSTGLGLRYSFSNHVQLEADYGWQHQGRSLDPQTDGRTDFNLTFSY